MSPSAISASRVVVLDWDSRHFALAVGRLEGGIDGLEATVGEADREGIRLLIARPEATAIDHVHCLERVGFRLTDTLVRYERTVARRRGDVSKGVAIRPAGLNDAPCVEGLAAESFENYPGHFRNDPRLDARRADLVYVHWAKNACVSRDGEHRMFIAELDHRAVGFGAVECAESEVAEGTLYAVAPGVRGRGVAGALVQATVEWADARGCRRMFVYSSVANAVAQRVWLRAGFVPAGGLHTLHRWADGVWE